MIIGIIGRSRVLVAILLLLLAGCGGSRPRPIVVGSKNFTEQSILGELLAQQIERATGLTVERRFYLAGSYICHQAILAGRIDLYVEYTGTALTALLKEPPSNDPARVYARVRDEYARRFGLEVLPSLGFSNTFALVVRGDDARRLGLKTISQAAAHSSEWRLGVGYELLDRPDGYPGLVKAYRFDFRQSPRLMDLGLIYRALREKQVDMVVGNSTDGLISALDMVALVDDHGFFPPYEAVPVARREALQEFPALRAALAALAGKISEEDMRRMNYEVDGKRREVRDVAAEFLRLHPN